MPTNRRASKVKSAPPPAVNPEGSLDKAIGHDIDYLGQRALYLESAGRNSLNLVGRGMLPDSMAR